VRKAKRTHRRRIRAATELHRSHELAQRGSPLGPECTRARRQRDLYIRVIGGTRNPDDPGPVRIVSFPDPDTCATWSRVVPYIRSLVRPAGYRPDATQAPLTRTCSPGQTAECIAREPPPEVNPCFNVS